jgi:hypothetical protein
MSGLVAACKNKRKRPGILKKREPTNNYEPSDNAGVLTTYVKSQTKAAKRARFNQHVLIRQTSDGGNRDQSGAKGTAKFYDGELGPEGMLKTDEERETSNKQRDIDYVFVYVIHSFSKLKLAMMSKPQILAQIDASIKKYAEKRKRKEEGRERVAYTPTKKDIYDKCVEILAELETKHKIDVKGGHATLSLGDDGIEGVLGKTCAVNLKNYLGPNAVAAAAGKRRRGKRELADKTTLIF